KNKFLPPPEIYLWECRRRSLPAPACIAQSVFCAPEIHIADAEAKDQYGALKDFLPRRAGLCHGLRRPHEAQDAAARSFLPARIRTASSQECIHSASRPSRRKDRRELRCL